MTPDDPHGNGPVITDGPPPAAAAATLVMLHGRGGGADDIHAFFQSLALADVAAVIPEAAGRSWYPYSFLAPIGDNQPHLRSALARVETIVSDLLAQGVPSRKIILFGFSQGACLAAQSIATQPRRYGAFLGLSGGFIGPIGTGFEFDGDLDSMPVLLGAVDPDPHVPYSRVDETATVLRMMGADVDLRRYPGLPHSINQDEVEACLALIDQVKRAPAA